MASSPAEGSTRTPSTRPISQRSARSTRSSKSQPSSKTTEETPLLAQESRYLSEDVHHDADVDQSHSLAESSLLRSLYSSHISKSNARWPTVVALVILFFGIVLIMFFRFLVPQTVTEYAKQAIEFRPTNITLDSFTVRGMKIRIQGDVTLDASKVRKPAVRRLGRLATSIAKEAATGPADVSVFLPDYDNGLAVSARVPGIKIDIRNQHVTHLDFVVDIEPGPPAALRSLANDWIHGLVSQFRVYGKAVVPLQSGIINIGNQTIVQDLPIDRSLLPGPPTKELNVSGLSIHAGRHHGVNADANVIIPYDYIFGVTMPPVGFDVLVENCAASDPHIKVANGSSGDIHVVPGKDIQFTASAYVGSIPTDLTKHCEGTKKSPLDALTYDFSHGRDVPIYVKCCNFPDPRTPRWAQDLLRNFITMPVPFPGQTLDHLLQNFSLTNTHFSLPDPLADPGTPEAQPQVSTKIQASVALPLEMANFPLNVSRVRADAIVYYRSKKLGKLDISEWQDANSTKLKNDGDTSPMLLVESIVEKAPLEILDSDVFSDVVQKLIFSGKSVMLNITAEVDVEIKTPIGDVIVRQLPAEGAVPVKPMPLRGKGFDSIKPSVHGLKIVDTTPDSLTVQVQVNITNPTNYSATVPYVNINILTNNTVLGHAVAENISVSPGVNENITVRAVWEPMLASGEGGKATGRELVSQYLSGYNVTLAFRTHSGTLPSIPSLGEALSRFTIEVPAPHLHMPDDPSKEPDNGNEPQDPNDPSSNAPHFIKYTTLHILSSTTVFTLFSPLNLTTLYIEHLNATAFYHESPVGHIQYDLPFAVPPGQSDTPNIPIEWNLGSVGYEAVKQALGGQLHVNASAEAGVRLGQWKETLWFRGKGIGAHVRL